MGLVLRQRGYEIDVWLTDPELGSVYGVQFDLRYDSSQTCVPLEYGPGLTPTDNPQPGSYRFLVTDIETPLPSHLVTLQFGGATTLSFEGLVASDQFGNALPIGAENGELAVASVTFQWTNDIPDLPGIRLFQGDNPVPDGTFTPIGAEQPGDATQYTLDIPADQGVKYYYVIGVRAFGAVPSNVVSLNTTSVGALGGLTVVIN